ncbi:MAG TPA: LapD/MoxY N-terminal periplasmic domain-containing protein, partial [Burkholderiaceae bacterium]|nr:LapD/MoxY N-terminal periplasmic domain-containing protein [Burkholderiaceae bacterium]
MSLMRQVGWLLVAVVLLALAGAVGVNLHAARDALQAQLRVKNSDNAQSLALALSQQRGDAQLMELLLAAQFDTGFYRSVRWVGTDGREAFTRQAGPNASRAPDWFVALWPIESAPGVAQVSDGWRALGRVEVVSHVAYAHDELWRGGSRSAFLLLALGAGALALAALGVARIRRPLDATVRQASALVEGRYVVVEEPQVPELRRVARAMNGMVERVRALFEAHAAQVDALRRTAHEDGLTGLAHRAHFMQRLGELLRPEEGARVGVLALVRLADLAGVNRELGRGLADQALRAVAQTLADAAAAAGEGALAGRLNGSDFALALPGESEAQAAAARIGASLAAALPALGARLQACAGATVWQHDDTAASLMSRADLALAHAESAGPFAAHAIGVEAPSGTARGHEGAEGEAGWHRRLGEALAARRARLVEYPVLDRTGALLHLECPLRLQLDAGGEFEAALRWLPLATRGHWLPQLDLLAVQLALQAIAQDGRERAVNLSAAALADGAFAARLRQSLGEAPQAARGLWLEVAESQAVGQVDLLAAHAALLRPLGVRLGIEHAGHALHRAPRLYELGLDYVKLDASLLRGAA